jgi:ABC-type multidrug transport system ATPase subunit
LAACELVEPLSGDAEIVFVDGQLDALDPWTIRSALDLMRGQMAEGRTFIVATHRPDLMQELDNLILVSDLNVRFAGSIEDLLRSGPPHTIDVATENDAGVRALVAPFQVSVRPHPDGMRLEAPEGQEIAARLLLDGYGDVKFVVMRPPTIEEALRSLV